MKKQLRIIALSLLLALSLSTLAGCSLSDLVGGWFTPTTPECEHIWVDADCDTAKTCSSCGATEGEALGHKDENCDHVCDNGCDVAQGEHSDANTDHICDYGCTESLGTHEAAEGKHTCDYCGGEVSTCVDADTDHDCDVCGTTMGTHEAAEGKHTCDYCGGEVSTCVDGDTDHDCDVCGVAMGTHEPAEGKHTCDYCGQKVSDCTGAEAVKEKVVEATCGAAGSYESVVYCSVCGVELSRESVTVPATGNHTYGDWTVVTEATYEATGLEERACGCGAKETRIVDRLITADVAVRFETENDLNRVGLYWADPHTLSIDNTVKYGEERGSLKVTVNVAQGNYILLNSPANIDLSAYDYVSFWVYNAGSADFKMGTTWTADTVCKVGEWTEVKISADKFGANGSVSTMPGAKIELSNITGFVLRIFDAGSLAVGDCFYISSIKAGKNEVVEEEIPANVAAKFDKEADLNRVSLYWADPHTLSIDNTVKYGDELGSLKVTVNVAQGNYILLNSPANIDLSAYDYVSFWVYNAGAADFTMGTTWTGDTVCKAGEWTEVKISADKFGANGSVSTMPGAKIELSNISGFVLRIFAGGLAVNDCFYISAVKGGMNPEAEEPEVQTPKVSVKFDEEADLAAVSLYTAANHTMSIDTTMKHGDDNGSLKLVTSKVNSKNYVVLKAPQEADLSGCDYVSFWIYNAGSANITAGTTWAADTVCKPGEWTEIRIDASLFGASGKVTHVANSTVIELSNMTNFAVRLFNLDNLKEGECIYVSSICGGYNAE